MLRAAVEEELDLYLLVYGVNSWVTEPEEVRHEYLNQPEVKYIPVTCNKILLSQLCVGMYFMTVASPELSRQQSKEPQLLPVCQSVCTRTLVHSF